MNKIDKKENWATDYPWYCSCLFGKKWEPKYSIDGSFIRAGFEGWFKSSESAAEYCQILNKGDKPTVDIESEKVDISSLSDKQKAELFDLLDKFKTENNRQDVRHYLDKYFNFDMKTYQAKVAGYNLLSEVLGNLVIEATKAGKDATFIVDYIRNTLKMEYAKDEITLMSTLE